MDPAVVDRRALPIIQVDERDLPVRSMSIAGVTGSAGAKILSKDQKGPATRLVQLPQGWGTGLPGAFDADVELFVIDGELDVGGDTIGPYDYAALPARLRVGGLRATTAVTAILLTSAPVRYDMTAGGAVTSPLVSRNAGLAWHVVEGFTGRFERRLADGLHGAILVGGSKEWVHDDGWHRHDGTEEMFVLEGSLTMVEWLDGAPVERTYGPGAYVHRAASTWHAGPGSTSSETAITFHRIVGTDTDWAPEPS